MITEYIGRAILFVAGVMPLAKAVRGEPRMMSSDCADASQGMLPTILTLNKISILIVRRTAGLMRFLIIHFSSMLSRLAACRDGLRPAGRNDRAGKTGEGDRHP